MNKHAAKNQEPFPNHPIFDPKILGGDPSSVPFDEDSQGDVDTSRCQSVDQLDLETLADRLQESELTVICGRPSTGKTTLAMSMAANIAIRRRMGCAFFSLEMDALILMQRLVSDKAHLPVDTIQSHNVRPSDLNSIMKAASDIYEAPLYIIDSPSMELGELLAITRELKAAKDIQVMFIDDLTFISPDTADQSHEAQRSDIVQSLKALAHELHIAIVVIAQLKRGPEGKSPTLADFQAFGVLNPGADLVVLLHKDHTLEFQSSQER